MSEVRELIRYHDVCSYLGLARGHLMNLLFQIDTVEDEELASKVRTILDELERLWDKVRDENVLPLYNKIKGEE